jgi:hypothetical protein
MVARSNQMQTERRTYKHQIAGPESFLKTVEFPAQPLEQIPSDPQA